MATMYIVREEIIIDNTFNEGIITRTTDKNRAIRKAEKAYQDMLKHPNLIGCTQRKTENRYEAFNAISGDSYIIEIEEYSSDIE